MTTMKQVKNLLSTKLKRNEYVASGLDVFKYYVFVIGKDGVDPSECTDNMVAISKENGKMCSYDPVMDMENFQLALKKNKVVKF